MATFSVYNYKTRQFDYFEHPSNHTDLGSVKFSSHRKPMSIQGNNQIGTVPESIASTLPPGVRCVGSGVRPLGVIAYGGPSQLASVSTFGSTFGEFSQTGKTVMFAGLCVLGFFAAPKIVKFIEKTF